MREGAAWSGTTAEAVLRIDGLSKTFVGTRALDDVSLSVTAGEVRALLGGNGSGKSTLIKILAGVYRGDPGGTIEVSGRILDSDATTPAESRELGLRFVHQDPGIVSELTVMENIGLVNGFATARGGIRWRRLRRRSADLLERFDIDATPDQRMESLRAADRTMVAIARALEDAGAGLSVLVLDEPTAALPQQEVELLLEAIRRCAAAGQTILYVSHRIDEVLAIADRVTVLRDGREVVTRSTEQLTPDTLIEHIVGRPLETVFPESPDVERGEPVLEIRGLTGGPLRDVSFDVYRGEIVGVAGLLGSGRTELLRSIFGAYPLQGGEIRLAQTSVEDATLAERMQLGVAYVPEDRALDAAFLDMTVRENLSAADVARYFKRWVFDHGLEHEQAEDDIAQFHIRTAGDKATFASLSGGNQQKVILARWLRRRPLLLLLDEPTQGVDVGARADVFAAIDHAVEHGVTVILVSSDFEELARVVDRALILRDGRIAAELRAPAIDSHSLTQLVYTATSENGDL
jgi:ribose transport system ATP-binding protein